MYIHLGTTNDMVVQAVYTRMREEYPDEQIITAQDEIFSHDYQPGKGVHVLSSGEIPSFDDVALERWYHLYLASLGARFWFDEKQKTSAPTYAGQLLRSEPGINKVVVDAIFAENRAKTFKASGVNYIGRTYGDPRTAVLVDYKKDKTHNPTNDSHIRALLASLPEDIGYAEPHDWGNFAIISTSNVSKLETFVDELSETNFLVYSTGAIAKMNFIGRDFGHIGVPKADKKYGLEIREIASRMRPEF